MNATTNPGLIAFLNDAIADGTVDLQRAVNDCVRTAVEHHSPELRDAYMNAWFDDHAGNSLLAWLHDGIITKVEELPTGDADVLHALDPAGTLIVATWFGA